MEVSELLNVIEQKKLTLLLETEAGDVTRLRILHWFNFGGPNPNLTLVLTPVPVTAQVDAE